MTARLLYEAVLIELRKENAPNLLLEDFNYFANKAVNLYVNKKYNLYDINQQSTDDLRVLKSTGLLNVTHISDYSGLTLAGDNKMAIYEAILPPDYLHLLNCICIYKVNKTYKCYNAGDTWRSAAKRLTSDMYSQVLDNMWNKPSYKTPYYYIHNINTNSTIPTNPYNSITKTGTDATIKNVKMGIEDSTNYLYIKFNGEIYYFVKDNNILTANKVDDEYSIIETPILNPFDENQKTLLYTEYQVTLPNDEIISRDLLEEYLNLKGSKNVEKDGNGNPIAIISKGLPKTISIYGEEYSNVERTGEIRYGNTSLVRMEIRYGTDNSVFELKQVYVDYIKAPQFIRLTQKQLDMTEDISQQLEYPDYVCQEIINELVHLIMENLSDLRLQTHPIVTLSIANPTQALTPEQQQQ